VQNQTVGVALAFLISAAALKLRPRSDVPARITRNRRQGMRRIFLCLASILLVTAGLAAGPRVDTVAQVEAGTGGIEVDSAGNVYTSDFGTALGNFSEPGKNVWKVSPDGKTELFAEGFNGASGSAIDSKGNFFQANIRGNFISKIAPDGTITKFASEGLTNPVGIVIDDEDTLWVANCGSGSIQKITSAGVSTRFVDSNLLSCPNGITRDPEGNLYAANFYNGNVIKITPAAGASVLAKLPGGNNGHLVYSKGSLFVVDRGGHRVYKVSLAGELEVFAGSGKKGGADGTAAEASFCFPNDIDVSDDGKTFYVNDVADEASTGMKLGPTRIRRISTE
jgi:sugar lactone lactonase YvrE